MRKEEHWRGVEIMVRCDATLLRAISSPELLPALLHMSFDRSSQQRGKRTGGKEG